MIPLEGDGILNLLSDKHGSCTVWNTRLHRYLSPIVRYGSLLLLTSIIGCQLIFPGNATSRQNSLDGTYTLNRIAYVDSSGIVYTIDPDGTGRQQMTGSSYVQSGSIGTLMAQGISQGSFHSWPTWSPDGTKLAVSRISLPGNQEAVIDIQIIDVISGRSTTIENPDVTAMVADNSPHYLYWAPDSRHLSFLASTRLGLTLYVVDTDETHDRSIKVLEVGAPLFYSWGSVDLSLLVHLGKTVKLYDRVTSDSPPSDLGLSTNFRTPAFSKDGLRIAYIEEKVNDRVLRLSHSDRPMDDTDFGDIGASSAFSWSPKSDMIALADQDNDQTSVFNRLRIISPNGTVDQVVCEEPFMAYYWSPNARYISWVSLDSENREFEWKVKDITSPELSEPVVLFKFQPSADTLTALSFFDQYSYSHSMWSPDSTQLVVTGTENIPFERRNGHTPTGSRVYVLTVDGSDSPKEIGEGTVAFWSWN